MSEICSRLNLSMNAGSRVQGIHTLVFSQTFNRLLGKVAGHAQDITAFRQILPHNVVYLPFGY